MTCWSDLACSIIIEQPSRNFMIKILSCKQTANQLDRMCVCVCVTNRDVHHKHAI